MVAGPKLDEVEAKKQRKAARRAAKEAAAAANDAEEEDVEAKKQRKAARRAAKEATAADDAEEEEAQMTEKKKKVKADEVQRLRMLHEDALAAEIDEEASKKERKAAKRAAKAAAAVDAVDGLAEAKKNKRPVEAEEFEKAADAPRAKKSKKLEAAAEDLEAGEIDKNAFKVFIKGLPYSVDGATLRKDFSECGEITFFKMPVNEEGSSKGFAFIQYAAREGFAAALKFDNTDYHGRYLNVLKAADKDVARKGKTKEGDWTCPSCGDLVFASKSNCRKCGTAKPGGGEDNENTVFIRGLPWAVSEDSLRRDFSDCGEIERLSLPKNEVGKPKGISFIKYKSQVGVDAALKFDNTEYGGRTIFVSIAGNVPQGTGKDSKGKGQDGRGKGKDGKGKGKGKGKEGKQKFVPTAAFANKNGCIVEGLGDKKTFVDSDED